MKYFFTTTALVGVVLAVAGSATPISQQTPSSTISTPSFGLKYHTIARGPFTAFAASETHAPAPYRTYDFHGFKLGQVVPKTPLLVVSTSISTSVRRTPTKMNVTGSPTPTALFPNFHPHFGHGPVASGRGFNSSHSNSNWTKPGAPASFDRPFKSPVHHPWQPHNELLPPSNLNGTTQVVPKTPLSEDHKAYCKKHWVKLTFVCEKGMRVNRWWNGKRHNHTKPHTHHNKPFKSLRGRSIHLSPRSSPEVTSTLDPPPAQSPSLTSTPIKTSATTIPTPLTYSTTNIPNTRSNPRSSRQIQRSNSTRNR